MTGVANEDHGDLESHNHGTAFLYLMVIMALILLSAVDAVLRKNQIYLVPSSGIMIIIGFLGGMVCKAKGHAWREQLIFDEHLFTCAVVAARAPSSSSRPR
jgi:hypothetical protein